MEKFSQELINGEDKFKAAQFTYNRIVSMSNFHYHPHYEILYLQSGKRQISINDTRVHTLDNNHIALIKPYLLHKTLSVDTETQSRILVNISADLMQDICKDSPWLSSPFECTVIRFNDSDKGIIKFMLSSLLELDENDAHYNEKAKIILSHLFMLLYEIKSTSNINNDLAFNISTEAQIQNIIKYIIENFEKPITLNSLSALFGFHPKYLSRAFKRYVGTPPITYLNIVRINNAKALLCGAGITLETIAFSCGFNSLTSFGRVFKKLTGITPGQYRESIHESK